MSALFSRAAADSAAFARLQQASVTFQGVEKWYGEHRVLNGIDLHVEPGEVVAILGTIRLREIHADPPD